MLRSGGDRFIVRIPVADGGKVEVARNDHRQLAVPCATPLAEVKMAVRGVARSRGRGPPAHVALDGLPLFQAMRLRRSGVGPPAATNRRSPWVCGGAPWR